MRVGRTAQQGFTLIAVLVALALIALASQRVMSLVSQEAQRQREDRLLATGRAYVAAIASYYESSPGSVKQFPAEVSDLLADHRFITWKRHLREAYDDPVSRTAEWLWVRSPDGGIAGVRSASNEQPLRTADVDLGIVQLEPASRYSDWQFVYVPARPSQEQRP